MKCPLWAEADIKSVTRLHFESRTR